MSGTSRRNLLKGAIAVPLAAQLKTASPSKNVSRPVVIASANGLEAVKKAWAVLAAGGDPVDAVVSGVNIVEDDPNDVTVGYGGIPNEEGVVQLDASVMDGRTMKAGAVAALEGIKNPSKVARLVMDRTDRVLLVGPGALLFAKAHGFHEENLLTNRSRKIWLYWKEKLSQKDDWIEKGDEEETDPDIRWFIEKFGVSDFRSHGTINCDALTAAGDLAGTTTTCGLFFKIPGRVGDSPIIGAGLFVDNEVGACGSTGWGEGNLRSCGSHTVVELMRQGKSPEQATLETLQRIVKIGREKRDGNGRPDFDLKFYAVNKKGEFASASIWSQSTGAKPAPARFAVADASGARLQECAYLFKREKA
jgi:N4-(beta-N-acetylglucosaminyl)-L-asparaginase